MLARLRRLHMNGGNFGEQAITFTIRVQARSWVWRNRGPTGCLRNGSWLGSYNESCRAKRKRALRGRNHAEG